MTGVLLSMILGGYCEIALTQLTWGAPQVVYDGGLTQARVRYYDAQRHRPGLPPDVAALVSSIDPAGTTVTLVNLSAAGTRAVVVQAGAYAEHDIETAGTPGPHPGGPGSTPSTSAMMSR